MKEKVTIMAAKPQFIRLSDGSLMNINNIVAISEADGDVFVSAYKRIPITKEDMADVLENIEIIDDDEQPHHCGQDAEEDQTIPSLRHDVLGKEVICVGGNQSRCVNCPHDENGDDCVKLELLNGTYICLTKHQQDKQPVISSDEEDDNKGLLDIMAEIKEKADDFMDYLDKVVINPQEQ